MSTFVFLSKFRINVIHLIIYTKFHSDTCYIIQRISWLIMVFSEWKILTFTPFHSPLILFTSYLPDYHKFTLINITDWILDGIGGSLLLFTSIIQFSAHSLFHHTHQWSWTLKEFLRRTKRTRATDWKHVGHLVIVASVSAWKWPKIHLINC